MSYQLIPGILSKQAKATLVALGVAGGVIASGTAHAEGQLNIYNWGDYINPEVLTRFTKDTGIEVKLDTYGSNEEIRRYRLRYCFSVSPHA